MVGIPKWVTLEQRKWGKMADLQRELKLLKRNESENGDSSEGDR